MYQVVESEEAGFLGEQVRAEKVPPLRESRTPERG